MRLTSPADLVIEDVQAVALRDGVSRAQGGAQPARTVAKRGRRAGPGDPTRTRRRRPALAAQPASSTSAPGPSGVNPSGPTHKTPDRCLVRQHARRPPAVHRVALSSHLQPAPVHGIPRGKRPQVTGVDWRGHPFITRNEGVPGSSPGVGFRRLCRGKSACMASVAGARLEHIPANACSRASLTDPFICRHFSTFRPGRDFLR